MGEDLRQESHGNQSPNVAGDHATIEYDNRRKVIIKGSAFGTAAALIIALAVIFISYLKDNTEQPVVEEVAKRVYDSKLDPEKWGARLDYDRELVTQMQDEMEFEPSVLTPLNMGNLEGASDEALLKIPERANGDKAALYFVQGGVDYLNFNYNDALDSYEKAFKLASDIDQKIRFKNAIGMVELARDRAEEAKLAFQAALELNKDNSHDYKNIAASNNNLGKAWFRDKDDNPEAIPEAIKYFEAAIEAAEDFVKQGGRKAARYVGVADYSNNLAAAYDEDMRCEEAENLYKDSQTIYAKNLEDGYNKASKVANTFSNQGILLSICMGKYDEAIAKLNEAIDIRINALGEIHPSVAFEYFNKAVVYQQQGKKEQAIEWYEKSKDIFVKANINPDNKVYSNLADRLYDLKNPDSISN